MYNFRSFCNKCPTTFLSLFFSYFTPSVRPFFTEKRKPKIFGFKNVTEGAIRKILTFVIRQIAPKILGIIKLNLFVETRVPLGWPNRYKFYSATKNAFLEVLLTA